MTERMQNDTWLKYGLYCFIGTFAAGLGALAIRTLFPSLWATLVSAFKLIVLFVVYLCKFLISPITIFWWQLITLFLIAIVFLIYFSVKFVTEQWVWIPAYRHKYCKQMFGGIAWSWEWQGERDPIHFHRYCPNDGANLEYEWENQLHRCTLCKFQKPYDKEIEVTLRHEIDRNVQTGNWKQVIKEKMPVLTKA